MATPAPAKPRTKKAAASDAPKASVQTHNLTGKVAQVIGAVIASAVHQRHDALKAYRTTVKDLLLVVKKSLNDKAGTSTDEATKQDGEV